MPVASLTANTVSYTYSHGVNPGSQYAYRIQARRANGSSAWGQATVTTPASIMAATLATMMDAGSESI